jgi:hypothetical protein
MPFFAANDNSNPRRRNHQPQMDTDKDTTQRQRRTRHCSGSAPAPGAVFRALAENLARTATVRAFVSTPHALLRNARRVPPHPRRVCSPDHFYPCSSVIVRSIYLIRQPHGTARGARPPRAPFYAPPRKTSRAPQPFERSCQPRTLYCGTRGAFRHTRGRVCSPNHFYPYPSVIVRSIYLIRQPPGHCSGSAPAPGRCFPRPRGKPRARRNGSSVRVNPARFIAEREARSATPEGGCAPQTFFIRVHLCPSVVEFSP